MSLTNTDFLNVHVSHFFQKYDVIFDIIGNRYFTIKIWNNFAVVG